mgnify:FL=1
MTIYRTILFAAGLLATACVQPGPGVDEPDSPNQPVPIMQGTVVEEFHTEAAPVTVNDVSKTDLGGIVIYDEVIPFHIGLEDTATGKVDPQNSIRGALQSRVTKSTNTGTLIFSYRFRDLVFTYQPNTAPQFIEYVALHGFDKSFFPLQVFNIAPSQSLGTYEWGGIHTIGVGSGGQNDRYFHWASHYATPEGTTWVEFLTKATKYKTGKYLSLSPSIVQQGGSFLGNIYATLDKVAVPMK